MNAVNYGYSYVTLQGIYKNLDEKMQAIVIS